jgi:hypothetical protein
MDLLWELFSEYMTRVKKDQRFISDESLRVIWKRHFASLLDTPSNNMDESIKGFLLQLSNTRR